MSSVNGVGPGRSAARDARLGRAYSEEAFRFFLALERKRAARAGHSFLLVLVSVEKRSGPRSRMDPLVASGIFSGLRLSVRDMDFIGWFREERVAGAVLTQGGDPVPSDVSRRITQRLTQTLCRHLPSDVLPRLHVQVRHVRPRRNSSET